MVKAEYLEVAVGLDDDPDDVVVVERSDGEAEEVKLPGPGTPPTPVVKVYNVPPGTNTVRRRSTGEVLLVTDEETTELHFSTRVG